VQTKLISSEMLEYFSQRSWLYHCLTYKIGQCLSYICGQSIKLIKTKLQWCQFWVFLPITRQEKLMEWHPWGVTWTGIPVIGVNLYQGKRNLVWVSREFELSKFELPGFHCNYNHSYFCLLLFWLKPNQIEHYNFLWEAFFLNFFCSFFCYSWLLR